MGDLVLVGLESGLPCHRKDLWFQESTTNHHFSWYSKRKKTHNPREGWEQGGRHTATTRGF